MPPFRYLFPRQVGDTSPSGEPVSVEEMVAALSTMGVAMDYREFSASRWRPVRRLVTAPAGLNASSCDHGATSTLRFS